MKVAARNIGGGRDGAQEKRTGPGKAEGNMGTNKKTEKMMEKPGLWSQAPDPVCASKGRNAAQVLAPLDGV